MWAGAERAGAPASGPLAALRGRAGMLRFAAKMLVNDRAKFSALLVGITFAVFLMIQMTSIFAGILSRASAMVSNIGASVWVMDPAVNNVVNGIPVPDYLLDALRSTPGVAYAVPLFSGGALAKLHDGTFQAISVIGLDDTSLFGYPQLEAGRIDNLYADNGFIMVRDAEYPKLGKPVVGTEFQINDRRAVIVGVARVNSGGLFGVPTLYTTYSRALHYIPSTRFTMSFILVEPKNSGAVTAIARTAARLGYLALTRQQFVQRISDFYKYKTGIGTNILLMTSVSFLVGLSISGQTFYTFILENLDKFGALKAIGARGSDLVAMILFQAVLTALTGYGLGVGLAALAIWLIKLRMPDYAALLTYGNLALAFGLVLVIAALSSYIGVRKVLRIEPFDIFRA